MKPSGKALLPAGIQGRLPLTRLHFLGPTTTPPCIRNTVVGRRPRRLSLYGRRSRRSEVLLNANVSLRFREDCYNKHPTN